MTWKCFSFAAAVTSVIFIGAGCGKNTPAETFDSDMVLRLARPSIEVSEVALIQDTLVLVSGARFFFHPFGDFTSVDGFQRATKSLFTLRQEVFNEPPGADDSVTILYRFSYSRSFVKCILPHDPESSQQVEIVSGRIVDSSVQFVNGIHTGISKTLLLDQFFSSFPEELSSRINVVEVATALSGEWHYYECSNGVLSTILLDSDYTLPKD